MCVSIQKRLPEVYDIGAVQIDYPIIYEECMNTVLSQELQRYNDLLVVVKNSLVNMRKSLSGEVVMSAELEALGTSMTNGQVPDMWHNAAYPSLKPLGSWVDDLLLRFKMFNRCGNCYYSSCMLVYRIVFSSTRASSCA